MLDSLPATVAPDLVFAKGARDPMRHQRVGAVHELEMEVGSRRVSAMPHPSEHLVDLDLLASPDRHGAGRQMGEPGVDVTAPEDDVVAHDAMQVVWGRAEGQAVLEDEPELPDGVDPAAFREPVAGRHHHPSSGAWIGSPQP